VESFKRVDGKIRISDRSPFSENLKIPQWIGKLPLDADKFTLKSSTLNKTLEYPVFSRQDIFCMNYYSDQSFQNLHSFDFETGEYNACSFVGCNFSNLNFQGSSFENCTVKNCDLSNSKVSGVPFQNVRFETCKILGVHFNVANPFLIEFNFQGCQLDYCNFYNLKLKKSIFQQCRLLETDFTQADLSGASFTGSELSGAIFDASNLERADFRDAINYRIDPEKNRIKGARFDLEGLPGLLERWGIRVG
jgi:fluoroquinolone resistance protein